MSGTIFARGENPLRADKLNTAFSERVSRRGDAMQGMLTLWRDPINPFDAATKQYVDRITVPPQGATGPQGPTGPTGPQGPPGSMSGGGTLTGPLYYTATGGNTSRSAQDRAADTANVLDYGADPTGVLDSSAAINAAASTRTAGGTYARTVYLPSGQYHIRNRITLKDGQSLRGDGRGNTVLTVSDDFSSSAASVILIGNSFNDPGPTISDLRISFAQPSDVTSRGTFKTIAAGGTSHAGGTGVQYPWVVSQPSSGGTGRVNLQNVRIEGAWNGITDGGNSGIYWVQDLQICAINCGFDLGSNGIFDWTHWSDVEFWPFGFQSTGQDSIWKDGQTIAMRLGQVNGLVAQNISCFYAKIIITTNATNGWFQFTNLSMDGSGSTIAVGSCFFLQFANLYHTSGADALAPLISTAGGVNVKSIHISNWYAFISATYPMVDLSGGGQLSIVNAELGVFNSAAKLFFVNAGTLRMSNARVYASAVSAWTVPLIHQDNTGAVQLSNVDFDGAPTTSGNAIYCGTDNAGNLIGAIHLGTGWGTIYAARANGQYGPYAPVNSPTFTGLITFNGGVAGMSFGAVADTAPDVFSKHLTLFDPGYGIGVTAARVNYITPAAGAHAFRTLGTDQFIIAAAGVDCYPPVRLHGHADFSAGISFNGNVASSSSDLSKHIELYAGYGFCLTGSRVNYVAPSAAGHYFVVNGVDYFSVTAAQFTCVPSARFSGFIGFQGAAPMGKPTVSGSRVGNAALASLLTALASYGLVTDSSGA